MAVFFCFVVFNFHVFTRWSMKFKTGDVCATMLTLISAPVSGMAASMSSSYTECQTFF